MDIMDIKWIFGELDAFFLKLYRFFPSFQEMMKLTKFIKFIIY